MSFIQRNLYNPDTSFTPLFRLLDDFDTYTRQGESASPRAGAGAAGRRPRLGLPHWQPRFDVRETGESYELHGELPGVDRRDVEIEFSDPQTMLIRGRIERAYEAGAPLLEAGEGTARIEGAEKETEASKKKKKDEEKKDEVKEEDKKGSEARYWLSERSVGEFSRSFNFPGRVDQDAVTANIKDGILNVCVPKARHEARRITVE
ncbi:30 kDa heat shock protein [Escovopsis weberi]|uniref:30 kDa heat shock protein n=1 Tax=Escovopsis weberi TaxID=150374 RepID=A0A0M8N5F5_ESCWE|nr:30 kDa heat shock protein [Escovopsis weberi]